MGAAWFDQSKYLEAVTAWASGDLDPARHYYLPGYPLLGAAFGWLTPAQPFWLPDLLCLLLSQVLFAAIAARLFPAWRWGRALGAVIFLASTAFWPQALRQWVIPWSTTPTVPLTYAAILAALRFHTAPRPGPAALAAVAASSLALFRPTDAMAAYAVIPAFMACALVAALPGFAAAVRITAAAVSGAVLPLAVLGALHVAIHGFSPGAYVAYSASVGFEWGLVPLRWVMIVLGPQPFMATHLQGGVAGGKGLAVMFPWIIPGLAGMAACLLTRSARGRGAHAMVVGVTAAQMLFYLAYRDLHAEGLWRFDNVHYFKVTLPIFGLYAAAVVALVVHRGRHLAAAAGALAIVPLVCWRAELRPTGRDGAQIAGPHSLALARGLAPLDTAIAVAATGDWHDIYFGAHTLQADGVVYARHHVDLKTYPVPGGFILVPLRMLPAIPSVLAVDPAVDLDPTHPPIVLRQAIRFGLPCLLPRLQPSCTPRRIAEGAP